MRFTAFPHPTRARLVLPRWCAPPFEALPSRVAVPVVTVRPVPPRRYRLLAGSTSRPCSTRESVAPRDRFRPRAPVAPLGFPPEASRPSSPLRSASRRLVCRSAPKRVCPNGRPKPSERTPDKSVRLLRASLRPALAGRASSRSPTHALVAPPRRALAASLRAHTGKHLAGASPRRPRATPSEDGLSEDRCVGLTSSCGRRVIASPRTDPFPRTAS
jgi:hypothetical protein